MAGSPLEHEAVWTVSLQALGHGSLHPGPVDATKLLELSADVDALATGFKLVPVRGLPKLLERYVGRDGMLHAPWPGPDRDGPGNWVWSDFSAERVRHRAETIYTCALAAYEYFVTSVFASLATRLRTFVILPAVARGSVSFSQRAEVAGAPLIDWWLEPVVAGPSRAQFTLGPTSIDDGELIQLDERLKRARPAAARWVYSIWERGVLDIFRQAPAQQLMYEWLWKDLQRLKWINGGALGPWPHDRLPVLTP